MSEKGKCYSKANRGQRRAKDFYQTPRSMTRALFSLPEFKGPRRPMLPILEPSAGNGAMVKEFMDILGDPPGGIEARDILHDGYDFLKETRTFSTVITNPPFSLSFEFINKCKEVATDAFALLMPIEYLHGQERYQKIYDRADRWPLSSVNVFTRRAMLSDTVDPDGFYRTGMITWAWYVWRRVLVPRKSAPMIRWIDNDRWVIRKSRSATEQSRV